MNPTEDGPKIKQDGAIIFCRGPEAAVGELSTIYVKWQPE
jgi:hypothetical protein